MSADFILFDPLLRVPMLTGLALAVSLSLIGAFLRLRNEWLSALGLSQVSAAGAVAGIALGVPVMFTAVLAAVAASVLKSLNPKSNNSHYALMIIVGWSGAIILAANTYHGEVAGETFLRGQLYFTHTGHLIAAGILVGLLLGLVKWLSPRLLTERFFPDYYSANNIPARKHRLLFTSFAIFSAVLGTVSLGAFPAFAMFFVPSWVGFVIVEGWRKSLFASVIIGSSAYLISFTVAVLGDQPFGPVLVLCLSLMSLLRLVASFLKKKA